MWWTARWSTCIPTVNSGISWSPIPLSNTRLTLPPLVIAICGSRKMKSAMSPCTTARPCPSRHPTSWIWNGNGTSLEAVREQFERYYLGLPQRDVLGLKRASRRDEMLAQAIDAFLAREMWSGGFIAPPPPMEVPPPFPWRPGSFRLRRPN